MGEFKPHVPSIYGRMERGEIPRWLGLSILAVVWGLFIIPVLCLTSPIWGAAGAYAWLTKPGSKPVVNSDEPSSQ